MYNVIWTPHFSLAFGATTHSITTVFTLFFMAGLAFGSLFFGRVARSNSKTNHFLWMKSVISWSSPPRGG
jgi:hypothetical protein